MPYGLFIRRKYTRHLFLWAGCLSILLVLIAGGFFYQRHFILLKEKPVTTLQEMHVHLGERVTEIKKVQEEFERLDQQQSVLETITRHQSYSQLLLTLAAVMNEEIWLRQLILNSEKDEDQKKDKEENTALVIDGFSYSNEQLGNFINQLSNEAMFTDVILKYAKETVLDLSGKGADEAARVIEFKIECNI